MKKTIKLLGLLLLSAALFMGCNHSAEEENHYKDGLFDFNTATTEAYDKATFNYAELADGEWVYKGVEEFKDTGFYVEEITFTKTGTAIKITKGTYYMESGNDAVTGNISDADIRTYETNMNHNLGIFTNFKNGSISKRNAEKTKFFSYAQGIDTHNGTEVTFYARYFLMKK